MAKILFNELIKETQKRLIQEAIEKKFNVALHVTSVQVYRDLFMEELDEEKAEVFHFVFADTSKGTFQLRWSATYHHFMDDVLLKKKKGIELPPVQAPEPVKKDEKKHKRTPKEEKKNGKVQENGGNAEAQVS